jgi:uncharacterized protein YndB with AHSA1/START domain
MTVRRARTVAAGAEELWELVSDPDHLPRWWPGVVRVEEASPVAWTKVLSTPKGRVVRADFTRAEAEPPRRLVWRQELVESPFERILSEAVTEIALEPEGEAATRVELRALRRLRGLSRLGGLMVRPATRRQLDEALDGLERVAGRA